MKNYLPVLFIIIAIVVLILLSKRREGFIKKDDTMVRLDKLETADEQLERRLSIVEKELKTAKEEQAQGEAQVNAGIGNIQAIT